MDIRIEYCAVWNYLPEASRVEAELKASYPDSDIKLIKASGGVFDVICNGKRIFSKLNIAGQRFPREGEISKLIRQAMG